MIDDGDAMRLSDYCFSMCETLKTATQWMNAGDLDGSARAALRDLERCADLSWTSSSDHIKELQGYTRNRADPRDGNELSTHQV